MMGVEARVPLLLFRRAVFKKKSAGFPSPRGRGEDFIDLVVDEVSAGEAEARVRGSRRGRLLRKHPLTPALRACRAL
ncbi:hypothetical protein NS229_04685 [Methylobacterium indicum]|nr:hypothetical protein NS229_04685 [Methylobacterium indicum]